MTTDYLYTGQRQESEVGLYYYVARWYDPAIGRFIQADSVVPNPGRAVGWDRYSYTYNNPIKYNDPSGHTPLLDGILGDWPPQPVPTPPPPPTPGKSSSEPSNSHNDDIQDNGGGSVPVPVPEAPYSEPDSCVGLPYPCSDIDFYTDITQEYDVIPIQGDLAELVMKGSYNINPGAIFGEPDEFYSNFLWEIDEVLLTSQLEIDYVVAAAFFKETITKTTMAETPNGPVIVSTSKKEKTWFYVKTIVTGLFANYSNGNKSNLFSVAPQFRQRIID